MSITKSSVGYSQGHLGTKFASERDRPHTIQALLGPLGSAREGNLGQLPYRVDYQRRALVGLIYGDISKPGEQFGSTVFAYRRGQQLGPFLDKRS